MFEPTGLEEVDGCGVDLCHERTAGHAGSPIGHSASAMRCVYQFLASGALAIANFDGPRYGRSRGCDLTNRIQQLLPC